MVNRMTNQTTPKKHRFNIIDKIVLVLIVAIAVSTFLLIDPFKWFYEEKIIEDRTVLYTVEIRGVTKKDSGSLSEGDEAILITKGADVGKIVKLTRLQSSLWQVNQNADQMIVMRNPEKDTVYITIEIACTYQEGVGYFINDRQLFVGENMELKFTMFDATGECVSIMEKE